MAAVALVATAEVRAVGFEKLALMDSLDMAYWCDVETKEGTLRLIEDAQRPGSNGILWRDKGGGGMMRYPSNEEPAPQDECPVEKRRVPIALDVYYELRLDNLDFDVFDFVFGTCAQKRLAYGIHQTFEENHTGNSNQSGWTIAHPQFWNCAKDGVPFPAHASLAFPEVRAHKLRFAAEHVALKPQKIFLDVWRAGSWTLQYEYVKPNVDRWHALHPGEPLPDATDERWIRLCSESTMGYLRDYGALCRSNGVEFVVGWGTTTQNGTTIRRESCPGDVRDINGMLAWQQFGFDWRQLVREGTVDGIWVMNVAYDPLRPFESTRETLAYMKADMGSAKLYFGVNWYNMRHDGIESYATDAGVSNAEAARRLLDLAKDVGCAGIVYECVDCHCYPADVCDALKETSK